MNYLKFTPYLYLVLGIYLTIDAIINWNNTAENAGLTLIFSGVAFFLFAFRLRYAKRFQEHKNKRNL
jgi:uncharacterized membrane protein YqhA